MQSRVDGSGEERGIKGQGGGLDTLSLHCHTCHTCNGMAATVPWLTNDAPDQQQYLL